MRRRGACLLMLAGALAFSAAEVSASFARMTEAELVAASALIVSGTLIGTTSLQLGGRAVQVGVLQISAVHRGERATTVVLLALPDPRGPRSSSDVDYRPGQSGLWFLRQRSADEAGLYLADHPQRFTPATQAAVQLAKLKNLLAAK